MARSLSEIIDDAKDTLRTDYNNGNIDLDEPHDQIHEIADSAVPVYHSQLLSIAAENNEVALREPEIGPAFDGKPTPVNIIAANIFELVEEALFEYAREIQKEEEEKIDALSDMSLDELTAELKRAKESKKESDTYIDAIEEAISDKEDELSEE